MKYGTRRASRVDWHPVEGRASGTSPGRGTPVARPPVASRALNGCVRFAPSQHQFD
jgi:hypothetical protein